MEASTKVDFHPCSQLVEPLGSTNRWVMAQLMEEGLAGFSIFRLSSILLLMKTLYDIANYHQMTRLAPCSVKAYVFENSRSMPT